MITRLRVRFAGWVVSALVGVMLSALSAASQITLTPWGALTGMRVAEGFVEFEGGLRLVHPEWTGFSGAVKYLQRPRYRRDGPKAVVESAIEGVGFRKVVEDTGPGEGSIDLEVMVRTNLPLAGLYYCFDLPEAEFASGTLSMILAGDAGEARVTFGGGPPEMAGEMLRRTASGVRVEAPRRRLEVRWEEPRTVVVRRQATDRPSSRNDPSIRQRFLTNGAAAWPVGYQVYLEMVSGNAVSGRTASLSLKLRTSAVRDGEPVRLGVDPSRPGRRFDGVGGNFRLQFPQTDPAVIAYTLEHLRSAWGRFDLPWPEWDPDESVDPMVAARAGTLHPKVVGTIDTARTLARRRVPIMVSVWVPPTWARFPGPQAPGLRGVALDTRKLDRICSSLTGYLVFLKEHAGVEAAYVSLNEPETGVEVRQTPAEHVAFIQAMGGHLARAGLMTKLLLGDTAHGTMAALDFILPALAEVKAHPYIGAVAFHTWRGCTAESLYAWADVARLLGVPLMVTESGPDAHLHEYPSVRLESWFALQEIELYLRICALAQPSTIMEWQFTTDYSVLRGGGVYGESGPLEPTQRFWNLKQLAATPAGAFALPVTADHSDVTLAAFADLLNGQHAVHMVNRGALRRAILTGLPASVSTLRRYVTDATRGMEEGEPIPVREGRAEFDLLAASYTTLLSPGEAAVLAR